MLGFCFRFTGHVKEKRHAKGPVLTSHNATNVPMPRLAAWCFSVEVQTYEAIHKYALSSRIAMVVATRRRGTQQQRTQSTSIPSPPIAVATFTTDRRHAARGAYRGSSDVAVGSRVPLLGCRNTLRPPNKNVTPVPRCLPAFARTPVTALIVYCATQHQH